MDIMKALFDVDIEIDCHCGKKFKKKLGWLKNKKNVLCPHCRGTVLLDGKHLGKAVQRGEKAVDSFLGSIPKKL